MQFGIPYILNEEFFNDVDMNDVEVDNGSVDDAVATEEHDWKISVIVPMAFDIHKYREVDLSYKRSFILINHIMHSLKFFEADDADIKISVHTHKDTNFRDFSILSKKLVLSQDDMSLKDSDEKLKQVIWNNIEKFVTSYEPKWESIEECNFKILADLIFTINGNVVENIPQRVFIDDILKMNKVFSAFWDYVKSTGSYFCVPDSVKVYIDNIKENKHVKLTAIDIKSWSLATIDVLYKGIYGKDLDDDILDTRDKTYGNRIPAAGMYNICYKWSNIVFYSDIMDSYDYKPLGYSIFEEKTNDVKFYSMLKRKVDSEWNYEKINAAFKKFFFDKIASFDKQQIMRTNSEVDLKFYIAVQEDDIPPRSDSKKTYKFEYSELLNSKLTINYSLIYVNPNFIQIGKKSRAWFSQNAMDASHAANNYTNDLIGGAYGRATIKRLDMEYFPALKRALEQKNGVQN